MRYQNGVKTIESPGQEDQLPRQQTPKRVAERVAAAKTGFQDGLTGTGTREWSDHSYNIYTGCAHDCGYCYARPMALRFGRIACCSEWANQVLLPAKIEAADRKFGGTVMFPTTHDITPDTLKPALQTLENLLAAGNWVLVVSKPHLSVVQTLCRELVAYREQLQFRFTIGSGDAGTCVLWEPGAPAPKERISALEHAHDRGFETSVSMEPMLSDNEAMCSLVARVMPFVSGTIWLGKLNGAIPKEIQAKPGIRESLLEIRAGQSDECILRLHDRLALNPKIRWKDSIKKVLQRHGRLAQQSVPVPTEITFPSVADAKACLVKRAGKNSRDEDAREPDSKATPNALDDCLIDTDQAQPTAPKTPSQKAWETIRRWYTPEQIRSRTRAAARKAWQTMRAKRGATQPNDL